MFMYPNLINFMKFFYKRTSTNPKPDRSIPSMHSAFLSNPAARPRGLEKDFPHNETCVIMKPVKD